ncbi:hypothetical protein EST38_g3300, partial [Candolleomyces aberdarensis]
LQAIIIDGSHRFKEKHRGRRIVLIDTPALDEGDLKTTFMIIGSIAKGFKASYGKFKKMALGGVVYLQDISSDRVIQPQLPAATVSKLNKELEGPNASAEALVEKTVLVTTKWSRQDERDFSKHHEAHEKRWESLKKIGAKIERLDSKDEVERAWQIVEGVLERADSQALQDSKSKPASQNWKNDPLLQSALTTDIVIPVMGATSAGKSSFINSFLSHLELAKRVQVGENLVSCTTELEPIVVEGQTNHWRRIRGHRIVIVDTPGFDDTYAEDFVILQRIAKWLEKSYRKKMVLGGVIFLHDISQDRFSGTARRNFELFKHLCGDSAFGQVVLVTSKWGRAVGRNLEKREQELKTDHWKTMLEGGARVERLVAGDEEASAWGVVRSILDTVEARAIQQTRSEGLQIQRELVNRHKFLPQTHAARELRTQLQQMLEAQTEMLALEADAVAGNAEVMAELQEQEEKHDG